MYAGCAQLGLPLERVQWVQVGEPEVQRQRGKWVVRQSGYDPSTGRRRVKQLGTHAIKRAALAQRKSLVEGQAGTDAESLGDFCEVWLRSKEGRVATSNLGPVRLGAATPRRPAPRRGATVRSDSRDPPRVGGRTDGDRLNRQAKDRRFLGPPLVSDGSHCCAALPQLSAPVAASPGLGIMRMYYITN